METKDGGPNEPLQVRAPFSLHLRDGLWFAFRSPSWFVDLLAGTFCQFSASIVPLLGPAIFTGYGYALAEALHRRHGRWHPPFTLRLAPDYLMRGLATLVLDFVVGMVLGTPVLLGALAVAAMRLFDLGEVPPYVYVLLGVGACFYLLATFFTSIMAFHAGMANRFNAAFDLGWLRRFIAVAWAELIIVTVARAALRITLLLVPLLFCLVGALTMDPATLGLALIPLLLVCAIVAIPFSAYDQMVLAHWMYQVYRIYLSRGGQPIALGSRSA